MAHSLSAKKRIRQNLKRRMRNKSQKSALKTKAKGFLALVDSGDLDAAQSDMAGLQKSYAQVASKGVLHKNTARRKISRLAKHLNRARAQKSAE